VRARSRDEHRAREQERAPVDASRGRHQRAERGVVPGATLANVSDAQVLSQSASGVPGAGLVCDAGSM